MAIKEALDGYLVEEVEATSTPYVQSFLTTFGVETLTGGDKEMSEYNRFVLDEYSQAFKNHLSPDFQFKMGKLWKEHREQTHNLVKKHLTVHPLKAYTAKFDNHSNMFVAEVSLTGIMQGVQEIF